MLVSLFAGLLGIASAEESPQLRKGHFTVVDDAFGKYFVDSYQCFVLGRDVYQYLYRWGLALDWL